MIGNFIISTIKKRKEISFEELSELAVDLLSKNFDGKVIWYLITIKLDLEAGKLLREYQKQVLKN